ncbi:Mannose-P-dolichol utilization defect 1 [Araneus ventricosus]|uniref:Mannose-P-dolichol utilization defect 1 protein homolog n=1 Tax=Araneus ventricosus TaxID=182803 RepID=A0A4Y2ME82_ARAVE|nr:Mannose-P-dolichol utilization defect 1 [Araneus ventricosus]
MGNFLRNVLSRFMSGNCYNEFFVKLNFFDAECLKHTISKALGTGIIAGSTLVKFPQILKLVNGKSAVGISFLGVLLELIAVTSAFAYNYAKGYPFSSWGESVFLMIETAIIAFLVLLYNKKTGQANVFAAVYSLITYMLYSGIVPMNVLWNMQIANVPIVVCGKEGGNILSSDPLCKILIILWQNCSDTATMSQNSKGFLQKDFHFGNKLYFWEN